MRAARTWLICAGLAWAPSVFAVDRMDLQGTAIIGNRELPKVLYIIPWKSAEPGDLVGRPVQSLLDEVLAPVDRDVFRRQVWYHSNLNQVSPPERK